MPQNDAAVERGTEAGRRKENIAEEELCSKVVYEDMKKVAYS